MKRNLFYTASGLQSSTQAKMMLPIMEAVAFLHKSGEPATLPHTLIIHRLKCYINCARICIALHSSTTTWQSWRYICQTPATRGRSSARSPAEPIKPPTDRTRPPSAKGRYLPFGSEQILRRKGWMVWRKEERMKQGKEKWERVYIQDEPLCWRTPSAASPWNREDEEARLDARVHTTTSRPLVAQLGHFHTPAKLALKILCSETN